MSFWLCVPETSPVAQLTITGAIFSDAAARVPSIADIGGARCSGGMERVQPMKDSVSGQRLSGDCGMSGEDSIVLLDGRIVGVIDCTDEVGNAEVKSPEDPR